MITLITPEEAKKLLNDKKNINILDVRTPKEFENGHLENANNLNFYDANFPERIEELPHDKKYLIYCHSVGRAFRTGELMEELGFREIIVVKGEIVK
ncbi:rhodanese-like domain-containing protein [Candidatus Woesearchaeota archaeon]|nr:rhodanese-like domain-containing protein [Candidatus Woesearchaeota archaeon]